MTTWLHIANTADNIAAIRAGDLNLEVVNVEALYPHAGASWAAERIDAVQYDGVAWWVAVRPSFPAGVTTRITLDWSTGWLGSSGQITTAETVIDPAPPDSFVPVPEPGLAVGIVCGVIGLVVFKRWRGRG